MICSEAPRGCLEAPEAAWRPVMMMEIASTTPTIAVIETILTPVCVVMCTKCPQKRNSMTVTAPPRRNGDRLYLSSYNLNEIGESDVAMILQ